MSHQIKVVRQLAEDEDDGPDDEPPPPPPAGSPPPHPYYFLGPAGALLLYLQPLGENALPSESGRGGSCWILPIEHVAAVQRSNHACVICLAWKILGFIIER